MGRRGWGEAHAKGVTFPPEHVRALADALLSYADARDAAALDPRT